MRLASQSLRAGDGLQWWSVEPYGGVRAPIIGLEFPGEGGATQQWLLSDQGIRQFTYKGKKLVGLGPPVPTSASPAGFNLARRWLAHYPLPAAAHERIPAEEILRAESMRELLAVLEREWAQRRIEPPRGLSANEISGEMEAFPHGVRELLAVAELFGG